MCDARRIIDGAYPELFCDYIDYQRHLGHLYSENTVWQVRTLSRFLDLRPKVPGVLSKEIVEEYTAPRPGEAVSSRSKRRSILRQFALFLRLNGYDCYLPPKRQERKATDFVPYIFSEAEIALLLAQADSQPHYTHTPFAAPVYSMLIRMLWCTGMRIGEALSLTVGDVDLVHGVLTVTKAKFNTVRLIPLSASLVEYAKGYCTTVGLSAEDPHAVFFPNHKREYYTRAAASDHIKKLMGKAGITKDGIKPPRVHDIRHSFAVEALRKMQCAGSDVYCSLPLLSVYMGHKDIQSTEYYLRLCGHAFTDIENAMADAYTGVFPEVD